MKRTVRRSQAPQERPDQAGETAGARAQLNHVLPGQGVNGEDRGEQVALVIFPRHQRMVTLSSALVNLFCIG